MIKEKGSVLCRDMEIEVEFFFGTLEDFLFKEIENMKVYLYSSIDHASLPMFEEFEE